ncbi:MAG TPA: 16S rRNA (cytidine(1402)-2'-O)-methyltransferase [Thermomicrobiales bacterium]|nr:16S rRNA (cytidine(1402)-2'-O)-methyltransferase [Thermomicrobiales bacterium]
MGVLYVVATPIGNLEDISPRALRTLREASLIAAEDTRRTRNLLRHFEIDTPLVSYHAHSPRNRREAILTALAAGDVALVSDAGTPGISDPGDDLVAAAHEAGFAVSPIPGPAAAATAVSASGLVPGPFVFAGFPPRKGAERRHALADLAATGMPVVFFEAANRTAETLSDLATVFGDRPALVARELTKMHEEIRRGRLRELAAWAAVNPPRGEIVIVVGGVAAEPATRIDDGAIVRLVAERRREGLSLSAAAREVAAEIGRPRSDVYDLARRAAMNEAEAID